MKISKGSILIVEDDPGVAELQAMRLKRVGHSPVIARTAQEALTLIEQMPFDLAVLDYSLEGELSGLDLFILFRERGHALPAILVTGFEDPKIIVQAMRVGVRDFLPKTAEYLDDLRLSVERVLRQVSLEREVVIAASIREKQELLEAAFEAGGLASFVLDIARNEFRWSGNTERLFGTRVDDRIRSLDAFLDLIREEDRTEIRKLVEKSATTDGPFDAQFRVARADGSLRWLSFRGCYYFDREKRPARLIVVMNDVTERKESELELRRSHQQIQALNDRLQVSVIETNHRAKNSLQNVVSLMHLQLRNQGGLNEEEVKKLTAHVQGLAIVHDVLMDQAKHEEDVSKVDLHDVLDRMLKAVDATSKSGSVDRSLQSCFVTSRQSASMSVIVNELISNAIKHGGGKISVRLENHGQHGKLFVINDGSSFPENFDPRKTNRTGLLLVRTLARSDLSSEPQFINIDGNKACVVLTFPLRSADHEATGSQANLVH